MELILDAMLDALIDGVKMLPFLYLAYLLIEWLERHHGERIENALAGGGHWGFFPGALLGCVPQCGFSAVASNLYASRVITPGTLLAVFIAGLMIGRTPEYLGKKIDVREMKLTALAILVTPTLVLMGAALAMMTDAGRSAMLNPGPHGFSEVLYAVSSAANNNGSAFAGLSANSPFWNCLLAFCMFVGRFGVIIPVMAIAGSLVSKKSQPASSGTLPTHGPLFVGLLIGTVLLVGALTFIPALALGPVAEYLS